MIEVLKMRPGDRVTLRAIVRRNVGAGNYSAEVPSDPTELSLQVMGQLILGDELSVSGRVVSLIEGNRIAVLLDGGANVSVLTDTVVNVPHRSR